MPSPALAPDASVDEAAAADVARAPATHGEPAPSWEPATSTAAEIQAPIPSETEAPLEVGESTSPIEPEPRVAASSPLLRLRAFVLMAVIAIVAFVTGLWVFNSLVMPRLIHGVSQVRVPDVRNLTVDQAEQALRSSNLQLSRAGERFDPAAPRGYVLSQDPPGGTAVRGRKRVSVVVSLGEEFSSVPELFGESQRSAEGLLRSAGLKLGVITRAPSEEVGEGLVAGSDPGPEAVLPHDATVSLLISTGAGEESYVMPEVLGREITSVRRQLEAFGFRVETPPGTASIGTILSQDPPPGSRITDANEIRLQATGRVIR